MKIDSCVQSTSSSVVYNYSDNENIPLLHPKVHSYHHNSFKFDPFSNSIQLN
jgi:hypothetical protein